MKRMVVRVVIAAMFSLVCPRQVTAEVDTTWRDRFVERLRTGRFTASTGTFFSSGDYGHSESTQVLYVPIEFRYDVFPLTTRLIVPYLRMTGPLTVVGLPGGGVIGGEDDGEVHTRQGLGDILADLSYTYAKPDSWLPVLRFTGRIKFGTADLDKRLGTGEHDFSLKADATKRFGPVTSFVSMGYRFVGDPPGASLNDTWMARTGLSLRVVSGLDTGLMYGWRQSSSDSSGDYHALVPYGSWKLGNRFAIMPYAIFGLSTYSPDFGGGMQISVSQPGWLQGR